MLRIAAMGAIDNTVLEAVESDLAVVFGEPVQRTAVPDPDYARDDRRGQYGAVEILRRLAAECPPGIRVLGITNRDLFIPMLTFLFGQAQLGGSVAVISLARLRQEFYGLAPDGRALLSRARAEALHEMGHVFGLFHCPEPRCAMALTTNIRQLDLKPPAFCAACALRLRERRAAAGRRHPAPASQELSGKASGTEHPA